MAISFFPSIRLLTVAGFTAPVFPAARRRAVDRARNRAAPCVAAQAAMQLVDVLLAAEERPDAYRDVLWQLDAAQRKVDQLPEGGVETHLLERILDALPINGEPPSALQRSLAAYEDFLRREARLAEALQALTLGVRAYGAVVPVVDYADYALRAGRLNRLLARWDRAAACFAAATEVGRLIDDETVVLRSRLGRGTVYQGQGELTATRAVTELVLREASRLGLADVQTRAYAELGIVLRLEGAVAEGLQAAYAAFQLATNAGDRLQALRDVGLGLAAAGAYDEARSALLAVRDAGCAWDALIGTSALIGLMGVESAVGDRMAFERWREEAETTRGRMPPGMAVAHRLTLGLGLTRFGVRRRAQIVLDEALRIAQANRLRGWCHEIEDRLEPVAMAG